jgi:DNA relaxase NicK
MKYNSNNISKVIGNIMLMIKIIDRSYERIVNEVNNITCTTCKDKDEFVNEIVEQIKDKKKHKFIKEQKKVLEKIRNEKMQKVVNKLRGLTYINKRRIFPEMEFNNNKFNSNMNINKYKIINKLATKSNEQLNGTDTLEMLQY